MKIYRFHWASDPPGEALESFRDSPVSSFILCDPIHPFRWPRVISVPVSRICLCRLFHPAFSVPGRIACTFSYLDGIRPEVRISRSKRHSSHSVSGHSVYAFVGERPGNLENLFPGCRDKGAREFDLRFIIFTFALRRVSL
ncbi:hypothetical protein MRX96_034880 [Rhipicephalus microplus]